MRDRHLVALHRGHVARRTRSPRPLKTRTGAPDAEAQHANEVPGLVDRQPDRSRRRLRGPEHRNASARQEIIENRDSATCALHRQPCTASTPSHCADFVASCILRFDVLSRPDHRQVPDPLVARQRRLRHRLPRRRHLDRQEGRDQGPAPPEHRLRRTAARTAPARQRSTIPNIVTDPDGGEAGQRLLHRDGVRAGRDARERSSRARARSTSPARSTTPARSATRSTTRTRRASSTATCGRRTCSSPTAAC